MSFRTKVSAVAITAAACVIFAPAALASSGPVQVTGKQLKTALLPASDFQPGYKASTELDSGRALEHRTIFKLSSLSCANFWGFIGVTGGFGETADATELIFSPTGSAPVVESFAQGVYQFASTHAAASFYGQLTAKFRSCRSLTSSDPKDGGTEKQTVTSRSTRVGGHQAVQLVESATFSAIPGPPVKTFVLWTIDGTDIYLISTIPLSVATPQPTQASLILKLISRVSALR
jgi:PknH-like extracellular domain